MLGAFSVDAKDIPGWNLPDETDKSENSLRIDVEYIIVHPLFDRK